MYEHYVHTNTEVSETVDAAWVRRYLGSSAFHTQPGETEHVDRHRTGLITVTKTMRDGFVKIDLFTPVYTNLMPLRTTTRALRTAEAIRDAVPFDTSGSLMGRTVTPGRHAGPWGSGDLSGIDLDWYRHDDGNIDYIVWSYSTPIAWRLTSGVWHRVGQSFSITTSKHQGNLYLIKKEDHETHLSPVTGQPGVRWRVECDTCGTVVSLHEYKNQARDASHRHYLSGRMPITSTLSHLS